MKLLSVCLLLAACTDPTTNGDNLRLDTSESDRVAGVYERDGVSINFEFSRNDDRHLMAFHDANGDALVTTTLDGAFQTTNVFDGRLVISGIPNLPDPTITGDATAMDELHARPEAALLEPLSDALALAEIEPALYQPTPPVVEDVRYDTWSTGFFVLTNQQSMTFLSAAGASPTYIYLRRQTDYQGGWSTIWYSAWSQPGSGFLRADAFATTYHVTKYWWGSAFTVSCVSYYNCMVRVSPYVWSPA